LLSESRCDQLERSERKDHLQSIRNNTRRMAGMMEKVLLLGSFDAGKEEFRPAALELTDIRASARKRNHVRHWPAMSHRTVALQNAC
jgi:hypothetical protein